jgi:hypothetical protein
MIINQKKPNEKYNHIKSIKCNASNILEIRSLFLVVLLLLNCLFLFKMILIFSIILPVIHKKNTISSGEKTIYTDIVAYKFQSFINQSQINIQAIIGKIILIIT